MQLHKNLEHSAMIKDGKIVWAMRDRVIRLPASADNISRLNKLIEDRGVIPIEAYQGRDHKDDRPLRQRIAEDGSVTTNKDVPKSKADILRDYLQDYRSRRKKETFEEKIENDIREEEIREEMALEESDRLAKNASMIEHATWSYLDLMFSNAPQSEVSSALKRIDIATNQTSVEYREAVEAFKARQEENALIAKTAAEQAFAQEQQKYEAKMAELSKSTWNETPAVDTAESETI